MRKEDSGDVKRQSSGDGTPPIQPQTSEPSAAVTFSPEQKRRAFALIEPALEIEDVTAIRELHRAVKGSEEAADRYATNPRAYKEYDSTVTLSLTTAKRLLAALRAAPASPEGWQPIESAPRDGRPFLAWVGEVERLWWFDGHAYPCDSDHDPITDATHWMSLPAAPDEAAGPRSRDVPQDDQIPTPKPIPILAREGQDILLEKVARIVHERAFEMDAIYSTEWSKRDVGKALAKAQAILALIIGVGGEGVSVAGLPAHVADATATDTQSHTGKED